jgi:inosine triphosphate pyrophosphatase
MPPRVLHFITGNKNKLAEVQAILSHVVEVKNTPLDLPEVQGTLESITSDKCKRAAEAVCIPVS